MQFTPVSEPTAAPLEECSASFVGTASVLLTCAGFRVLVDPTFLDHRDHIHLGYGPTPQLEAGSEEPPPLDLVVVSQLHEDPSARGVQFEVGRRLPILTTARGARTLRQRGYVTARGLAPWESVRFDRADASVRVTAVPGWAAPASDDLVLPDSMGATLEFSRAGRTVRLRIHALGDPLDRQRLSELLREPGVEIVLFHAGFTRVLGIAEPADAGPGRSALRVITPRSPARDEYASRSPLGELERAVRGWGIDSRAHSVEPGERYAWTPSVRQATAPPPDLEAGESDRPAAA